MKLVKIGKPRLAVGYSAYERPGNVLVEMRNRRKGKTRLDNLGKGKGRWMGCIDGR